MSRGVVTMAWLRTGGMFSARHGWQAATFERMAPEQRSILLMVAGAVVRHQAVRPRTERVRHDAAFQCHIMERRRGLRSIDGVTFFVTIYIAWWGACVIVTQTVVYVTDLANEPATRSDCVCHVGLWHS